MSMFRVDDPTLFDIFKGLKKNRLLLFIVFVVFMILAAVLVINKNDNYISSALLAPNTQVIGSRSNSSLQGLASLAGLGFGGSNIEKTDIAIATMKSRNFISDFLSMNNFGDRVYYARGWDQSTNQLVMDEFYVREHELDQEKSTYEKERSSKDIYDKFIEDYLRIKEDEETGFVTVSIVSPSPFFSKEILEGFISRINLVMRDKDIVTSQKTIEYLLEKIDSTKEAELRAVFYKLVEEQEQTKAMATLVDDYIFKVIDPPNIDLEPRGYNRPIIFVAISILGLLFGVFCALCKYFMVDRFVLSKS